MMVREQSLSRPETGVGHYLRDLVYGASDGVVTTMAVLAGTSGAAFGAKVGLILGLANLAADGLSMGTSNYLALKSELEQTGQSVDAERPWRHGLATSAAFVSVGFVPLLAYLLGNAWLGAGFGVSLVTAALTLAVVGALRSRFIARSAWRCAAEMVLVAGGTSAIAYGLGTLAPLLTD
jgi:VIT1/CCC1 family predicted Fe2+/Mn2+ transporter